MFDYSKIDYMAVISDFGFKLIGSVVLIIVGLFIKKIILDLCHRLLSKQPNNEGLISFFNAFIKILIYIFILMGIISIFGLPTSSFLALLGSIGLSIGLALQGSLANVAGGILIILLKPFKVGDYIKEDNKGNAGTVVSISIFHTKLKTPDCKLIVIPNGFLSNSSLTNYSHFSMRRLDMFFDLPYGCDVNLVKSTIYKVANQYFKHDLFSDDQLSVYIDSFGDSSIKFVLKMYVVNGEYWDIYYAINEKINLEFKLVGISMPYNQLDVHVINDKG